MNITTVNEILEIVNQFILIESRWIIYNKDETIEVSFRTLSDFVRAILSYSLHDRSPIFYVTSGDDDRINGYAESVKAIYSVICPNNVMLKYYLQEIEQNE